MTNLISYLADKGVTQAQFAPRVGVTQSALSKVCSFGKPSLRLALAIERETGGEIPIESWGAFSELADRGLHAVGPSSFAHKADRTSPSSKVMNPLPKSKVNTP